MKVIPFSSNCIFWMDEHKIESERAREREDVCVCVCARVSVCVGGGGGGEGERVGGKEKNGKKKKIPFIKKGGARW